MSQYLSEAFKKLDILNEDTFTINDNGIEDFVKFDDEDEFEDIIDVIDPEATTIDELQDSYVGKVILDCCVCHSKIYKDVEDVIVNGDVANEGEECPFCYTADGFKVVGQVAPFGEEETEEDKEHEVETKIEESYKDTHMIMGGDGSEVYTDEDLRKIWDESHSTDPSMKNYKSFDDWKADTVSNMEQEDEIEEGLFSKKSAVTVKEIKASDLKKGDILVGRFGDDSRQDKVVSVTDDGESVEVRYKNGGGFMPKDEIVKIRESLKETNDSDMEEGLFGKKNKGNIKEIKASELKKGDILVGRFGDDNNQDKVLSVTNDGESVEVRYKGGGGFMPNDEIVKIRESFLDESKSIREDINNLSLDTDDTHMEMTSNEDGKVTITTEPIKSTKDDEETIEPVDAELQSEIESNVEDGGEIEIDMDEFDEESFDELGESYLKKVYENVNSFKTSNVSFIKDKLILEGVIKFNSGKSKKTNFIFESREATKTGKVRFIGENKEIARGKKSFTVTGKMEGSKFLSESLNYNYGVKGANGKSQRLYGTVRTKKAGK